MREMGFDSVHRGHFDYWIRSYVVNGIFHSVQETNGMVCKFKEPKML